MAERRALIIDDNISLAETVAEVLAGVGFDVDVATSGIEALAAWRRGPATLVVVDIDLPDIGGARLARRLLRRAMCRLVLMSAGDPSRVADLCDEFGAAFLPKPFSLAHFVETIRLLTRDDQPNGATPARLARRLPKPASPRALLQHSRLPRRLTHS